jgi:hypothetical protein
VRPRRFKREGARRIRGVEALTWLKREDVFVSGRGTAAVHNARHAVQAGWLLVVEPSAASLSPDGWARFVECPVCGHALSLRSSYRILMHEVRYHNTPEQGADKFGKMSLDEYMQHAHGIKT